MKKMKRTQTLEPKLVRQINEFFTATEQHACAIRLRQPSPFGSYQPCDVLVLSSLSQYRLAIECKSVLEPAADKLYFSSHFTTDAKGVHQITRITGFCGESGMRGILAVELRNGVKGAKSAVHFVPWRVVYRTYNDGEKGIQYETVREWPQFRRVRGVLNLDSCLEELQYSLDE
jgi:hypothetical protein